MVGKVPGLVVGTLPETNSLLLKIDLSKTKQSSSNHPFSGAKMLVSGRITQQEMFLQKNTAIMYEANK